MALKVSDVIDTYIKLRSKKEAIEEETKARVAEVKERMDKIEAWFMQYFEQTGQTQAKASTGTVFTKTNDYANVADWNQALEFIIANEKYEFLEKRVSKTAIREFIDTNKSVPPGINYGTKISINVRKAST